MLPVIVCLLISISSEWGHDFRPAFKLLSMFKMEYPLVPITAVTATATDRVREDIVTILRLPPPPVLKMFLLSTARTNLHYEVRFKNDEANILDDFLSWLRGVHRRRQERGCPEGERPDAVSGIIYCQRRQHCEELAAVLRDNGIGAKCYHAGLQSEYSGPFELGGHPLHALPAHPLHATQCQMKKS